MGVIALIAFNIAWEVSPGGVFGSIIHYAVRTVVFIIMWAVTRVIIMGIKWIITNVLLATVIGCVLLLLTISTIIAIRLCKRTSKV